MRRWVICGVLCLLTLTVSAGAAEVPEELRRALPRETQELLRQTEDGSDASFRGGLSEILTAVKRQFRTVLRQQTRGAALVVLAAMLCGVMDGAGQAVGDRVRLTPMVGALSVTMISAGSLDSLVGLGVETIDAMGAFSKVLLPTLAAAAAASGAMNTATAQQVATVFFVDVLLQLIRELLLPLAYLYIGVLTASSMLADGRLKGIAAGLKKCVTFLLSGALIVFTVYLSVSRVLWGSVDNMAVKMTKTAISGVVPVVGGILADASETVLAGAGMLKNTVGIFGMLAILAVCALPFLRLGVQYLLYKLAAFLAGTVGPPELRDLIDGLAGAFGLVLGMTGACALLLLVSVLSSVAAVTP
ncbi:stage III sporulation protein AE [Dysosmobacter sp.]|uniref:stage III sporulation protein AE n=1 Tax=Dysosmobacter sp. TaxID=2591382 RepID=UPI002A8626EB|nr:stage III sporulation protein AE [Dysosmobacter sp.]MDY3282633.1 stage III sporulation protein AE [Dysosmobacter sp.]